MIRIITNKTFNRMTQQIKDARELADLVDNNFLVKDLDGKTTEDDRDRVSIYRIWDKYRNLKTAIFGKSW